MIHGKQNLVKTRRRGEDDDQDEEDEDEDDDSFEESTDEEEIFGNHDDDEDIDLLKTVDRLQSKIASRQPKERKKLIVETRQENEYNLPRGNQLSLQDMMANINEDENNKAILLDKELQSHCHPIT